MESFTKELVTIASAQIFPHETLSSSINFLPEQPNIEGQREVAISGKPKSSMFQKVTGGKFILLRKNFQIRHKSFTWSPVFVLF